MRVGSEKSEWELVILSVLGKIEMNATDEIPRRILCFQKLFDRSFGLRQFQSKRGVHISPERFEDGRGEIFGACHGGRCKHQRIEVGAWRSRDWRQAAMAVQCERGANGDDVP